MAASILLFPPSPLGDPLVIFAEKFPALVSLLLLMLVQIMTAESRLLGTGPCLVVVMSRCLRNMSCKSTI
jgi:hypothetical protein